MWRQGRQCYLQLSLQQGYNNQWPVMGGRAVNMGKNNPRVSHHSCYNSNMKQHKDQRSSKWENGRFYRNGRLWKKKGYWRRRRSQKQQQIKHGYTEAHNHNSTFCRICKKQHRQYNRKWLFRRQRLLAFMRAAIKGRLRPMNLCGWRAPGMRAPRNTTQFIMHQVYQDMHQERKAAAAAAASERKKEKSDLQFSIEENNCNMVSTNPSCMATILSISPEMNILSEDEAAEEDESNQNSYTCENIDLESHLGISCEP